MSSAALDLGTEEMVTAAADVKNRPTCTF